MNERIKKLRKEYLGLTLEKFGEKLGVKKSAVSLIEKGTNSVTEQMFKSICREFNVNPEWLRNGTGEVFIEMSKADEAAKAVGKLIATDDEFIYSTLVALSEWGPDEWKLVKKFIKKLKV